MKALVIGKLNEFVYNEMVITLAGQSHVIATEGFENVAQ